MVLWIHRRKAPRAFFWKDSNRRKC